MVDGAPKINVEDMYDQVAPVYSEFAQKRKVYIQSVDDMVLNKLTPSTKLLDVGTGDGKRLKRLMEVSGINHAKAIELSGEMVKLCQHHSGIDVYQTPIELFDINIGTFDVITALWNVLGHIDTSARVSALKNMGKMLSPGGCIMLDVNNRHNACAYGKSKVLWRRFLDRVYFKESRGDSFYHWKLAGRSIPSYGHLFVSKEFDRLVGLSGLKIEKCLAVNYTTGGISLNKTRGQLFYQLTNM